MGLEHNRPYLPCENLVKKLIESSPDYSILPKTSFSEIQERVGSSLVVLISNLCARAEARGYPSFSISRDKKFTESFSTELSSRLGLKNTTNKEEIISSLHEDFCKYLDSKQEFYLFAKIENDKGEIKVSNYSRLKNQTP